MVKKKKESDDFGKKVKSKKKTTSATTVVKKPIPIVPVVKKGFFSNLKEKAYKHRYKIASGVGTALVVSAGAGAAYKINKDKEERLRLEKQRNLLIQQNKSQQFDIDRLKSIPLPSTLNIISLKKYFEDSQSNLRQLHN